MKIPSFFVAGALCLAAPMAFAQEAAPSVESTVESAVAPMPNLARDASKNGYATLVAARKLILPGENGNPSTADRNLSPAENLRRQRAAVARNAPALKLLRETLQMPIEVPAATSENDFALAFPSFGSFREMARQLRQESDVRLADGDAVGALDSRLTILELGAAITRGGPVINSLVGIAIESIGRAQLENVAAKLDATQIRAALPRLKAVDARRATHSETLRQEKALAIRLSPLNSKELLGVSPEKRKEMLTPEVRRDLKMSEAEARDIMALTPEILAQQLSARFDAIIARGELPYERALKVEMPPASNAFVNAATDLWSKPNSSARFNYERNRAGHFLLEAALELRAIKLETGAYPANFAAPLDPFGDNEPLVYERKGDSYLLYSIGPDGQDNAGRAFKSTRQVFDPESGQTQLVNVRSVQAESRGDILAPIF
ncbi:hypothetical protein B1R32_10639 [Abditibacterium utsteinense]|uniref:Uncharacterized protein n=1 Tax=Abditibacterium utsteinense TaxID=1960156 RepID=A0A2S8STR5_9BACT|nr:hypothetical protein [Abditibacterium utsteinense]PQV64195.1 hypothetical protein B1R32_10639 [Abditibacterium utsteinense]